jgi:hypothetical protein
MHVLIVGLKRHGESVSGYFQLCYRPESLFPYEVGPATL